MAGLSVEWDGGSADGFKSGAVADRFIRMICQKVAPDIDYKVYSYKVVN